MEEGKINNESQPAPGAVIAPDSPNANNAPVLPEQPAPAAVQPQPVSQTAQPAPAQPDPGALVMSKSGFSWTGPEFARRDKPSSWYAAFVAAALVLGALIYFLTKDVISSGAIVLAILVLAFYNLRKPKDITYAISDFGLSIGKKRFSYDEFRSFTVSVEGTYLTVTFLPLGRFATTAGLFYDGNDEDQIVDFLAERMPMERYRPDLIDRLMRQIGL